MIISGMLKYSEYKQREPDKKSRKNLNSDMINVFKELNWKHKKMN